METGRSKARLLRRSRRPDFFYTLSLQLIHFTIQYTETRDTGFSTTQKHNMLSRISSASRFVEKGGDKNRKKKRKKKEEEEKKKKEEKEMLLFMHNKRIQRTSQRISIMAMKNRLTSRP